MGAIVIGYQKKGRQICNGVIMCSGTTDGTIAAEKKKRRNTYADSNYFSGIDSADYPGV